MIEKNMNNKENKEMIINKIKNKKVYKEIIL